MLAELIADSDVPVSQRLAESIHSIIPGTQVVALVSVIDDALPRAITSLATSGYPVTVLIYDADAFTTKRSSAVRSAALPDYIAKLEAAGASIITMPTEAAVK